MVCCVSQVLDVILAICLGSLAFADDIAVLVPTPRAMRMRHLLYICEQYAKKFSIMLNATKSAWLYVTKNKQTHHKFVPQFSIGGQRILTWDMLYLPVWMTENNVLCYFGIVIHYTVSQKVPTFKLSVTLSHLTRFSKLLHCWKAYEICYKTHMTSPISP